MEQHGGSSINNLGSLGDNISQSDVSISSSAGSSKPQKRLTDMQRLTKVLLKKGKIKKKFQGTRSAPKSRSALNQPGHLEDEPSHIRAKDG